MVLRPRKAGKGAGIDASTRAKYPRHSVERALRIPKAILEQNAGKPCTPEQAAALLGGSSAKGPFAVEITSAMKYGFLEREQGKIRPTELARRILRPTSTEDQVKACREAVLKAPEISDVYNHYRGENLPDDEAFFRNTLVDTYHIPESDYVDFKRIFTESLEKAGLFQKHGDKTRVLDVSEEIAHPEQKEARTKNLGRTWLSKRAKTALSCSRLRRLTATTTKRFLSLPLKRRVCSWLELMPKYLVRVK
jgi:hypothetical protein